ncbi:pathogenesis-related protein 1-like [Elaeis guineensis]|uniref:Pathogenesis-related protein 1-like n=1 Tax=Elaeis guineensis var. tenera TaxID=51953 RepID=A0A6I9Q7F2_ELAGV|nr:pathogenesis-related protein 1-like [Elaeis guineensis]
MGTSSLAFCMICAMALAMVPISHAQNSPEDFINLHNAARAAVGVGPVSWNDTVAAYAQDYADKRKADCQLVHSDGTYGENIFWGGGPGWTATVAVNDWVSERQYYDYASNSCAVGQVCGHYTQVVWAKSVHIGCSRVACDNGDTFITCNYDPPGNYVGERPYP